MLKDVDGLTPFNQGLLLQGSPSLIPCTPKGCMAIIKSVIPNLTGIRATVIGRSVLVGKPMAALLTNENATVTLAHSHTKNLKEICKESDLIVCAIGIPGFLTKDYIKKNAVVIDVGVNRLKDGTIVGDVCFEEVQPLVKAITPVPGGVGPMTVACLFENLVMALGMQIMLDNEDADEDGDD